MNIPVFDPSKVIADDPAWVEVAVRLQRHQVGSLPGVYVRKELSDLAKDEWQFNLFLLAMADLMVQPAQDTTIRKADLKKDYLSYFHLAGMHGLPAVDWAGVPQSGLYQLWQKNAKLAGNWWQREPLTGDPPDDFTEKSSLNIGLEKLGAPDGGYCVHGSPLFMPWHRPYLALIEQVVVYTAREIAKRYDEPDRAIAMKAAETLRFPFWDFSRPAEGNPSDPKTLKFHLPPPMSMKFVRVKKPGSKVYENIENPLYSFKYPDESTVKASFPDPVYTYNEQAGKPDYTTVPAGEQLMKAVKTQPSNTAPPYYSTRNPNKQTKGSDHVILNQRLQNAALVQRMRLYYTLTFQKDYVQAACSHKIEPKFPNSKERETSPYGIYTASLENIHDDYHNLLGGWALQQMKSNNVVQDVDAFKFKTGFEGALPATNAVGTFTNPQTAAFDPSFWFMHCFWEYTICLWQTIHTDSYWEDDTEVRRNADNCAWLRSDTLETVDIPLLPFRRPPVNKVKASGDWKDDKFWTTRDIQDWTQFGYTFPDLPSKLPKGNKANVDPWRADSWKAVIRVNDLYGCTYDPAVYKTATDSAERYDRGKMFSVFGDVWTPYTREDEKNVKAYYPIVDYKTLPWYPRLKDKAGACTDTTKIDELLVDLPPQPPAADPTNVEKASVKMIRREVPSPFINAAMDQSATISGPDSHDDANGTDSSTVHAIGHERSVRLWKFHYEVEKFGLKGPFLVHVFIGDFPASNVAWEACASHVHASAVWVRPLDDSTLHESACGNCNRQYLDKTVYGDYVPLSAKLLEYVATGERVPDAPDGLVLQSMQPDDVIPFLQRNLHWRVLNINGLEIPRSETPGLVTYITSRMIELPKAAGDVPVWQPFDVHHAITHERPSGLCHPNESVDHQHDERTHPTLKHIAATHITI